MRGEKEVVVGGGGGCMSSEKRAWVESSKVNTQNTITFSIVCWQKAPSQHNLGIHLLHGPHELLLCMYLYIYIYLRTTCYGSEFTKLCSWQRPLDRWGTSTHIHAPTQTPATCSSQRGSDDRKMGSRIQSSCPSTRHKVKVEEYTVQWNFSSSLCW